MVRLKKPKCNNTSPVRVVDPRSDGHAVILLPCQELEIKITKNMPGVRVTTESQYLTLKSNKCNFDGEQSDLYVFEQLYDLSEWCETGVVVLGNIFIETKTETVRLLLQCRKSSVNKVVTVINPNGEHIKIEPNQILEIVSQTPCDNGVSDGQYSFMHGRKSDLAVDGSMLLEKLREETVMVGDDPTRKGELFNVFDRSLNRLPENPKLSPMGRVQLNTIKSKNTSIKGVQQKHFWFRLNPAACEKVIMPPDVTYVSPQPLAGIVISDGKGKQDYVTLLLCQRALNKHGLPIPEAKDDVWIAAKNQGIKDKFHSPMRNLLVNPSNKEHHDLIKTDVGLYIEIASPSEMFSVADPKYKWELSIEPIQSQRDGSVVPRLKSVTLPKKFINGKEIQRFLIIRNMLVDAQPACHGNNGHLLGIVSLHCKNLMILGDRLIHIWDVVNKNSLVDRYDDSMNYSARLRDHTPPKSPPDIYKVLPPTTNLPIVRDAVVIPPKTVINVYIKEDCTPLLEGITEIYVYDSIIHKVFDEDRKKKWGHEHHNYGHQGEGKKKEINTPLLASGGKSVARSISQSHYMRQSIRAGNQTLPGSKEGRVIVTDPKDGDYECVQFNQELVVQLPLVDWGLVQDIQYCWTATHYNAGESKLFVKSQRLVIKNEAAQTRHYQEFVICILSNFIKVKATEIGKHLAGGIRFENTSSYLNFLVFLDVTRPIAEGEVTETNQQLVGLRELMKYGRLAKDDIKEKERKKAEEIIKMTNEGLLKPSSARAICVMEPIGEAATQVNEADRIKIMLDKNGGVSQFDLKRIPEWLDLTQRRQNDKHDIFEFETNPKVRTTGKARDSIEFVSLLSNARKEVRLMLSAAT